MCYLLIPCFLQILNQCLMSWEHLDYMLAMIPEDFLSDQEIDLWIFVIRTHNKAFAFNDTERGTFSWKYFPDYKIPVIEHTPWVKPPIHIPKAIEDTIHQMLLDQKAMGKYEYSTTSYHSRIFTVLKKLGVTHRSFGCANPRVSRGNPIGKSGNHSKEKITSNGTGR